MLSENKTDDANKRSCGDCTACCDGWLKINVDGFDVYPGKPCRYSSGNGCTIYSHRPRDPCQEFVCGWLARTSPLPEWMRPDESQVILLAANFLWQGRPVDVAVAVREGILPKALEWLKNFSTLQKRMLLYQVGDEWFAFGPPAFQTEMQALIGKGEVPWKAKP